MSDFKTYDPALVLVSFRGIPVRGYASGTFVNLSYNEDQFKVSVGSLGDTTRVRTRNRTGTCVLTLQAASPSNDQLSAAIAEDLATGFGFGPLLVKDLNGNTLAEAAFAWVRKPADVEYGDDASNREWTIECAELIVNVGGSVLPA